MSGNTIFGLTPFTPKYTLILPSQGGEIMLYVLDGKAYPARIDVIGEPPQLTIKCIHFEGWVCGFTNSEIKVLEAYLEGSGDYKFINLEVAFRLVHSEAYGQTAEIVAISYDHGLSYYENELSELPVEPRAKTLKRAIPQRMA